MGPNTDPPPTANLSVLVVEDHDATRQAIVRSLSRRTRHATGAATLAAMQAALDAHRFDVALVDLHLGDESGLDAIDRLGAHGVPSVMLTVSASAHDLAACLERGAVGYILKSDPPAQVVQALCDAVSGRNPISSGVAGHLFPAARPNPASSVAEVGLTEREVDVLVALARGLTYAEAAGALGCAVGTIQTHVKRVYRKLGLNSKTEACAWAYSVGLVD